MYGDAVMQVLSTLRSALTAEGLPEVFDSASCMPLTSFGPEYRTNDQDAMQRVMGAVQEAFEEPDSWCVVRSKFKAS